MAIDSLSLSSPNTGLNVFKAVSFASCVLGAPTNVIVLDFLQRIATGFANAGDKIGKRACVFADTCPALLEVADSHPASNIGRDGDDPGIAMAAQDRPGFCL